jgi:hypothetical protein
LNQFTSTQTTGCHFAHIQFGILISCARAGPRCDRRSCGDRCLEFQLVFTSLDDVYTSVIGPMPTGLVPWVDFTSNLTGAPAGQAEIMMENMIYGEKEIMVASVDMVCALPPLSLNEPLVGMHLCPAAFIKSCLVPKLNHSPYLNRRPPGCPGCLCARTLAAPQQRAALREPAAHLPPNAIRWPAGRADLQGMAVL